MKTLKISGNERKRPPGIYVCKCMRGCKRVCVHVRVCVFKQLLACWRAMPLPVPSRQKRCILRLAERGRVQQCRPSAASSVVPTLFVRPSFGPACNHLFCNRVKRSEQIVHRRAIDHAVKESGDRSQPFVDVATFWIVVQPLLWGSAVDVGLPLFQ